MTVGTMLWHTTTSLDGFIAGPNDAMDCPDGGPGPVRPRDQRERGQPAGDHVHDYQGNEVKDNQPARRE